MVGLPKTLGDLRKLEAALRVTCRGCGLSWIFDREALVRSLMLRQRSLAWEMLAAQFRCTSLDCGSRDLRVSAAAFADRRIARAQRPSRAAVEDALAMLRVAADSRSVLAVQFPRCGSRSRC